MRASRRSFIQSGLLPALGCASPSRLQHHGQQYCLPFSDVLPFDSSINGISYSLYVRTPANYPSGGDPLPVIVTLDADYSFAIAANHLEHLSDRRDQGPRALLVSIAYTGVYPDIARYRTERTRDYTPFFFPTGGYGPEFQAVSGGGPSFLRVIREEILPLVHARYNSDPNDIAIVGHSYGGLFAAWVLQNYPAVFQRYLLVSPSLWYAERALLRAEPALRETRMARPTYVFAAAGTLEAPPQIQNDMAGQVATFAAQLTARGDPNLHVASRLFEDENHDSVFPAAFSTGVRQLYRGLSD